MSHQPGARRSIIKHPHDFSGAPQILAPSEGHGTTDQALYDLVNGYAHAIDAGPSPPLGSGPAASYERAGELDLIPQRSAPPPPGTQGRAPVTGVAGSSASAFTSRPPPPAQGATSYSGLSQRSSYMASSASGGGGGGAYLASPGAGAGAPRSGLPSNSSGLPSNYASQSSSGGGAYASPGAAPQPPRPVRSNTVGGGDQYSYAGGAGSASGFAPSNPRSPSSVSGPSPSPHLISATSPLSTSSPTFIDSVGGSPALDSDGGHSGSQSTFVQGSRAERGRDGAGKNTFKSVFGGFVNSMSGK